MLLNRLTEFRGISTKILRNTVIIEFIRPEIRSPLSVFVLGELNEMIGNSENYSKIFELIIFTGRVFGFASVADLR